MVLIEKEWFIEAPWGKMCLVAWGNCQNPPVLCCHGVADSIASFRPLVQLLPDKFYYIGVELPGSGRSAALARGAPVSAYDLLYALHVLVRHFRWDSFALIAHSFGATVGRFYNLSYPGKISKVIDIDPLPFNAPVPPEEFHLWFKKNYVKYFEKYDQFNMPVEKTKKIPREDAIKKLMKKRSLPRKCAEATLERISKPAGDGYIRYTYDPRIKLVSGPPLNANHIQKLYTEISTPTLTIIAEDSLKNGGYKKLPFMLEEKAFPHGNNKIRTVKGNHDVHFVNPKIVAPYVTQFLLYGLEGVGDKAKL